MLRTFINVNQHISRKIGSIAPFTKDDIFARYEETVHRFMAPGQIVADIGGGKKSIITKYKEEFPGIQIYAIDISDKELEENSGADKKIVADVTKEIPLPDESVDMVISRSVLEHLQNQESFIKNCNHVLRSGGGGGGCFLTILRQVTRFRLVTRYLQL